MPKKRPTPEQIVTLLRQIGTRRILGPCDLIWRKAAQVSAP